MVNTRKRRDSMGNQSPRIAGHLGCVSCNEWGRFLIWEQGVVGSNPAVPTNNARKLGRADGSWGTRPAHAAGLPFRERLEQATRHQTAEDR